MARSAASNRLMNVSMCESREVPSGKVYRQLFDAQVQLSRSLLAGRTDTRTDCLSAEDSNTRSSTICRWLCPLASRGQQLDADNDVDDVSRLPDSVVVNHLSCDVIERLTRKQSNKHKEALKQMQAELTERTQVCETQVRTVSLALLSFLQEVDLRLNTLKDRMEHLEHVSLQEVYVLWEEVEEEVRLKKIRIMELNHKLTECETERAVEIRAVLRKYCHLLEKVSFLTPADVCRLIHTEATMLNQSLLANRRSVARLLLLLQEENLQQESLLRLHWEDCLSHWRRRRVNEVIGRFSSDEDERLVSVQRMILQMKQTQSILMERRYGIIYNICSLAPPSCSTALVSDWFNQLTDINQEIDSLHTDFLHQLRCCYEQMWQDRLAEVERCKEALSALQLSEEEVNYVVSSQLLTLIGLSQSQDEERLAVLDVCCDSVARHALSLSGCVFVMMRGAALLWETHGCRLEQREEELQKHLDDLRGSLQQHIKMKKVHLDNMLAGLRQESSEDDLKKSLDKAVCYLQDIKHSCSQCVSDQCRLLDRLPSLWLDELFSYSRNLSSFYHLNHTFTLSPEEVQTLHPSSDHSDHEPGETKPQEMTWNHPISSHNDTVSTQPSQDWLTEAESSVLNLYDVSSDVIFTSIRGVAYSGPAFRCPAPNLPDELQHETYLSLFPVELLTQTLNSTRMLFLDHLEQHVHDVLSSAVAMVTDRKETVRLELEVQLKHLNPQHIQTHIYQRRLGELQLHRRCVDAHCEEVLDVLTSCRVELQELEASISRKNQDFSVIVSNMEHDIQTDDCSQRVEAVSSTLQDCLHQHIKHTQSCETAFRQRVQTRLEEARNRTTQLLNSFRLFSEGGDFAPQEVKLYQRRLKEETKRMSVTERSIYAELEVLESKSLQQVMEMSAHFEEKLSFMKSEMNFREKIQKVFCSTQVDIKAEAASSNQQQLVISCRLEDLRRMMENTQVRPDQIFSVLSSIKQELMKRCHYLDFPLENISLRPQFTKQVRSAPPPAMLQRSRTGVDPLDDPVVGIIQSLNKFSLLQDDDSDADNRRRITAGQSPVQRPPQRRPESVCPLRSGRRFHEFGSEPEQNTHSFRSTVNAMLKRANEVLLLVAEDFYRSERSAASRFLLLPHTLDQWADSMQQRLLGYQQQAGNFLSTSRKELVSQLSVLEELLCSLSSVLISHHERQQGAGLIEEVRGVKQKLEETLAASEKEKCENVRQLRASLRDDELQALNSREELRQQQLHDAICCTHLEIQQCVRVREEGFVTSLASLTENLLYQLDNTPAETNAVTSHQHSDSHNVTMVTEIGQKASAVSRTWSGISHFSSPTSITADTPSSVTTTMTASTRHRTVIEQRDAAVKRFEQLFRLEVLQSDNDKQRRLKQLQSWNTHWRQQIHTLTHTHTHTLETADTHSDTHTHTHTGDSRYTL